MPRQLTCPECGETEELTGRRTDEGIEVSCDRCGARWPRDTPYSCATCGGQDIHMRAQALTQYSRGTQLSIVGLHHVPLCAVCDAEMLERANQHKPVPGRYEPAAVHRREDGDGGAASESLILPR
ncbi:hypothetical protein [Thermobifida halotolerans]|uniref:hypothetical protein n=1 Tax=Thermobifida halotolerans TaxID=483545 RepID=UPI0008393F33|nr:hypothetical protein [Thermobifida halotolerans]